MREKMAQLEDGAQRDSALLAIQRSELHSHKSFLMMVADRVGRTAIIAGEPARLNLSAPRGDFVKAVMQDMSALSFMGGDYVQTAAIQHEVMRLLDVDVIRRTLSREMHVIVRLGDGSAGYAISEMAIRNMGEDEIVRLIAPQIAGHLAKALRVPA
jgi:hypothetical protein